MSTKECTYFLVGPTDFMFFILVFFQDAKETSIHFRSIDEVTLDVIYVTQSDI